MNKDSIYKIIGYNGTYDANVKKAIRKLLKENHPDNHGDRRIFELICEVKNELENNKVSFKQDKKVKDALSNDGIDFKYVSEMIQFTSKERETYLNILQSKKKDLKELEDEYRSLYRDNIDLETNILNYTMNKKKSNGIKIIAIVALIITALLFVLSIIEKSITLFIIFVLVALICVIVVERYIYSAHKLIDFSNSGLKNYIKSSSDVRKNTKKQEDLKKEINDINKKLSNLDNDLRFYSNLLK